MDSEPVSEHIPEWKDPLIIEHAPTSHYRLTLADSIGRTHVLMQLAEAQAIALDRVEVRTALAWLLDWLAQDKEEREADD